jgi:hypothetical protein
MDYQAFLRQLESSTLPASEFTHQAHLYAAWAYRRQYPAPEAAVRCARALSRYAMAQGAAEIPPHPHHVLVVHSVPPCPADAGHGAGMAGFSGAV